MNHHVEGDYPLFFASTRWVEKPNVEACTSSEYRSHFQKISPGHPKQNKDHQVLLKNMNNPPVPHDLVYNLVHDFCTKVHVSSSWCTPKVSSRHIKKIVQDHFQFFQPLNYLHVDSLFTYMLS